MKIEYAVPCRGIETLSDGTLIAIGAEASAAARTQLPAPVAVPLMICISQAHPDEAAGELKGNVLNPNMERVGVELRTAFTVPRSPLLPEGWCARIMVRMQVTFNAESYGGYSIELGTGTSFLSVPFLVFVPHAEP